MARIHRLYRASNADHRPPALLPHQFVSSPCATTRPCEKLPKPWPLAARALTRSRGSDRVSRRICRRSLRLKMAPKKRSPDQLAAAFRGRDKMAKEAAATRRATAENDAAAESAAVNDAPMPDAPGALARRFLAARDAGWCVDSLSPRPPRCMAMTHGSRFVCARLRLPLSNVRTVRVAGSSASPWVHATGSRE